MVEPKTSTILFFYWGRSRALTRFVSGVHRAALELPHVSPLLCISRQNEDAGRLAQLGDTVVQIDTFSTNTGALTQAWRLPLLSRQLKALIQSRRVEAVVTLMPHVWGSFISPRLQRSGARHAVLVHDAVGHPGDRTGLVNRLLLRDAASADHVVTLSKAVADHIVSHGIARSDRVTCLFHPTLSYDAHAPQYRPGTPLRLLFLGRILEYKGLGLLIEAVEILRQQNLDIQLNVYGHGSLEPYASRLAALGAHVVNRWLSDEDIAEAIYGSDAMALSYIEASQSGVAATAVGAHMPTIATPVGGLREQVSDGVTGVMASATTASAFAEAVKRLLLEPGLYHRIRANLASADPMSMTRFVSKLVAVATPGV